MEKSTNQIQAELIRYYQQKDALTPQKESYLQLNNVEGYNITMLHYEETITTLRNQLKKRNPFRLQEIDTKRANDITVKGAIEIGKASKKAC